MLGRRGRDSHPLWRLAALSVTALVVGCSGPSATQPLSDSPSVAGPTSPAVSLSPSPAPSGTTNQPPSAKIVELDPTQLAEASGVTALADGTFAVIDDDHAQITIVGSDGKSRKQITLPGFEPQNVETIVAGPCSAGSCLYAGDIGGPRETVQIAVVHNENLVGTWDYRYPDGRYDSEAMVVDAHGLLLITKPSIKNAKAGTPHRIYRGSPGGGELKLVGTFVPEPPTVPTLSLVVGNLVTDAFYDGKRLLLLGYDVINEYTPPENGADPATFPTWPHTQKPLAVLPQAEGITGLPDGCGYAVVSETGPANLGSKMLIEPCPAAG